MSDKNENYENDLINKIAILEQLVAIKTSESKENELTSKQLELMKENEKLSIKQLELIKENEKLSNKQFELMKENEKLLSKQLELIKENEKLLSKQLEVMKENERYSSDDEDSSNNEKSKAKKGSSNKSKVKAKKGTGVKAKGKGKKDIGFDDEESDPVVETKTKKKAKGKKGTKDTSSDAGESDPEIEEVETKKKGKHVNEELKKYTFKQLQTICILLNILFDTKDKTKTSLLNKITNACIPMKELHNKINESLKYKYIIECRNLEHIKDLKCGCKLEKFIIGKSYEFEYVNSVCQKNHAHYYFTNNKLFNVNQEHEYKTRPHFIKKHYCNVCKKNCEATGFINVFCKNSNNE